MTKIVHTHNNTYNTVLVLTRVLSSSWRRLPGPGLRHTNEALLVYEGMRDILKTVIWGIVFVFFCFFLLKKALQNQNL